MGLLPWPLAAPSYLIVAQPQSGSTSLAYTVSKLLQGDNFNRRRPFPTLAPGRLQRKRGSWTSWDHTDAVDYPTSTLGEAVTSLRVFKNHVLPTAANVQALAAASGGGRRVAILLRDPTNSTLGWCSRCMQGSKMSKVGQCGLHGGHGGHGGGGGGDADVAAELLLTHELQLRIFGEEWRARAHMLPHAVWVAYEELISAPDGVLRRLLSAWRVEALPAAPIALAQRFYLHDHSLCAPRRAYLDARLANHTTQAERLRGELRRAGGGARGGARLRGPLATAAGGGYGSMRQRACTRASGCCRRHPKACTDGR